MEVACVHWDTRTYDTCHVVVRTPRGTFALPPAMVHRPRNKTGPTPAEATRPALPTRFQCTGGPLRPRRVIWRQQRRRRTYPTWHPDPPNGWDLPTGPIQDPGHHDSVGAVRGSRGNGELPTYGVL